MSPLAVGVDVGGTFTDLVSVNADGRIEAAKVASTPSDQSDGVASALALLGGAAVARFVHGTTVATNMLLERKGARVVLVTTQGFEDMLRLARQDRASLYDLSQHQPDPLVARERIIGVCERIAPEGVVVPLSIAEADRVAAEVARLDPESVVVSLLHSYADSSHERLVAEAIRRRMPNMEVIISSDVFPEIREYERSTTVGAEGYLRPGVARYLSRLTARCHSLGVPAPGVMTSGGGMRTVAEASQSAAALALSGPAGGIVGAAAVLRAAELKNAITVDIGGTSADVGLILDGQPLVEPGGRIGGVPIALPRVLVETVSAGGGSIGWIDDGGALRVGPQSAGADPGPAAFGRGGTQATVTDAHLLLGHIRAGHLSGCITLDVLAARSAIAELAARLDFPAERVAHAMIEIANANVARAMRRVSVERGVDPRECVLVPFGGGGPLHACGLAEQLGQSSIFVPPHAGVLSAVGLAITSERREQMRSVLSACSELSREKLSNARARLAGAANMHGHWNEQFIARMRYLGQGHELDIPLLEDDDGTALANRFAGLHQKRNGFVMQQGVEVIGIRRVVSGPEHMVRFDRAGSGDWNDAEKIDQGQEFHVRVEGPAVVTLPGATLFIEKGWTGIPHHTGGWMVSRHD